MSYTQTVTILDDDGAPENLTLRRVAGSPASLAEGKGPAEFEIAAGRGFIKDTLGVNLKVGGTAESPYYSSGRDWRMAMRIDGEWYAVTPHPRNPFSIFTLPTRLRVWAEADKVEEENETVTLTLGAGSGYTLGTSTSVSLTITDVPPPGIVLPAADVTVDEGATASYNVKLATDPGAGATVRVSITSGDTGAVTVNDTQSGVNGAQNYLDFTGGSGGSWNTHQAVTVRGVQDADTTNEADVTLTHAVSVQAGSSTPYTGLANRTLNVDVTDDDTLPPATPVVSITGSPSSMTEGDTATFTLTASPAPTEDISVQVEVTDSGDFASGGAGPQTVTVNTSGTAVFTVVTTDDEMDEPNGTITATVNAGTGYSPHSTEGSASVTVNDNDDPPPDTPVVSIGGSPSSMTEGGTATFTLTASPAPTGNISVAVTVAGGSFATGGPRTVTIPPLGTASFTVVTTDDETDEPNGTITATVNAGTGYAPHNTEGSASITVNDNDDP
ncbi:MAG: hypothetical protein OXH24_11210, partial [Cyanobacteria bacterium MAG IRC3_bin_20]|nr:hypothetical protein [Cyanobacteria bacterium MAG IRC3_bin_20]